MHHKGQIRMGLITHVDIEMQTMNIFFFHSSDVIYQQHANIARNIEKLYCFGRLYYTLVIARILLVQLNTFSFVTLLS